MRIALLWLIGLSTFLQAAEPINIKSSGNVISDRVLYSIGGGSAVSMGSAGNMKSLGVGMGWNGNFICGNMSLETTLQNQLNGVTHGFQTIMSDVIQNATSAVASLPALIIQRADPGLYNLLTNGILQARLDFDRSKLSCQAMSDRMADFAGEQLGWSRIAEGQAMRQSLSSGNDAVSAVDRAERKSGNDGVPWIGGANAGGRGQSPVKVISDVTRAGYNLLNGRSATETSSVAAAHCNNNLTCLTWDSPQAAATWATRVLGEKEQRTCDDCTRTQTTPGVGLTPLIQEAFESRLQMLDDLVAGREPTTPENLNAASSRSLPITRSIIENLRDDPDRVILMQHLASEVAFSGVLEQALLLQRTLLTGQKEPNVSASQLAIDAVDQENSALTQEINNLKTELELRQLLNGNTTMAITERAWRRSEDSRGIWQGDAIRNRLDKIQRPASENPP